MDEILCGHKILRGGYKLYLDTALTQGSIVKLDIIAKLVDITTPRYVEVTNFFLIRQKDRAGNTFILSEELSDYGQSLLGDVYKYYDINTLKSIKRLWMYLAYKRSICDLSMFTPLFSSTIAYYAQIIGDIEVAIKLLESSHNLPYDKDFLFQSLNQRFEDLETICKPNYDQPNCMDPLVLIKNLTILKECVRDIVNMQTKQWLSDNNIDLFKLAQKY